MHNEPRNDLPFAYSPYEYSPYEYSPYDYSHPSMHSSFNNSLLHRKLAYIEAQQRQQEELERMRRFKQAGRLRGRNNLGAKEDLTPSKKKPQQMFVRGNDGRLYRVEFDSEDKRPQESRSTTKSDGTVQSIGNKTKMENKTKNKNKNGNQKKIEHNNVIKDENKIGNENENEKVSRNLFANFTNPLKGKKVEVEKVKETLSNEQEEEKIGEVESKKNAKDASMVNEKFRCRDKEDDVVVEEASESESEDDDWKSVWCNRRPSPGQSWMEPIESI